MLVSHCSLLKSDVFLLPELQSKCPYIADFLLFCDVDIQSSVFFLKTSFLFLMSFELTSFGHSSMDPFHMIGDLCDGNQSYMFGVWSIVNFYLASVHVFSDNWWASCLFHEMYQLNWATSLNILAAHEALSHFSEDTCHLMVSWSTCSNIFTLGSLSEFLKSHTYFTHGRCQNTSWLSWSLWKRIWVGFIITFEERHGQNRVINQYRYVCTRRTNYQKRHRKGLLPTWLLVHLITPHRLHVHLVPKSQKRNWKCRLLLVFPLVLWCSCLSSHVWCILWMC